MIKRKWAVGIAALRLSNPPQLHSTVTLVMALSEKDAIKKAMKIAKKTYDWASFLDPVVSVIRVDSDAEKI